MKKLMVLVAALALVATSAMTAAAADWNFYGVAKVETFYVDRDLADTTNYQQGLYGNAVIGANVKVSDELTGGFQYGTSGGATSANNTTLRQLWGEWNFGAGSLLIGQHNTPLNMFYSSQTFNGDAGLLGEGGVYSNRHPMIRLKFGGFEIAALPVNTTAIGAATTETSFPAIEAKYNLVMDAFSINLAGGYQSFEVNDSKDVDSWVVAFGAKVPFGAFSLGGNVWIGENAGNLMAVSVQGDAAFAGDGFAVYNAATDDLSDNDAMGFLLVANFKANDMFTFEAGYGYTETELDNQNEDKQQAYYANATITLAPGVFIVPEVGFYDGDESGDDETLYYGAKWQINF
jgi:hypothetical protein